MRDWSTRLSTNRHLLRIIYYPWIATPYRPRRVATAAGIRALAVLKRIRGIHRQEDITRPQKRFALSFWGVPDINPNDYALTVEGSVDLPLTLSLEELKGLPVVERLMTLDCVGGSRNNAVMRGVAFEEILRRVQPKSDVETAVFHCGDGYFTNHPVSDLVETQAFLAYATNDAEEPDYGYPLRLVAPRKYGYKWAKWVVRIELVPGSPKGYWEQRGLPDRAWLGDLS